MRALLVFNPCSGARDAARRDQIVTLLGGALELEVKELVEGEPAEVFVREAIARGVEVIVAAGGDGTVSTCASGVIGSPAALGIVPCGTSNSIARALGLPTDVDAACAAIVSGGVRRIDVGRANGHAMVLLASIGFHADTIETTPSETKAALGKLAYVIQGIAKLADFTPFDATIETERGSTRVRAMAITVANLAPRETIFAQGADELIPDDGLLDLTLAAADTTLEALAAGIELAASALTGEEARGAHVGWVRCRRARVTADPPQHVLVDGDVIGTTPMDVEIVPLGLAIRVAL
jgi:YegS/Rv2252/BmrU family lipid kinase